MKEETPSLDNLKGQIIDFRHKIDIFRTEEGKLVVDKLPEVEEDAWRSIEETKTAEESMLTKRLSQLDKAGERLDTLNMNSGLLESDVKAFGEDETREVLDAVYSTIEGMSERIEEKKGEIEHKLEQIRNSEEILYQ